MPIRIFLLKAFTAEQQLADKDRQLDDKDKQLDYKDKQLDYKDKQLDYKDKQLDDKNKLLAQLIKDKDQIIAFQSIQLAKVEAKLLVAKSIHTAILTMRPVLEIYVALIFAGRTTTAGIRELTSNCITRQDSRWVLTQAARAKMIQLEGRDVPGVADALGNLMNLVSGPHHHPNHKTGFVCGGETPLRVATGIALVTAQEILFNAGNLALANFTINYCNDAWEVTCAFNNGTIIM